MMTIYQISLIIKIKDDYDNFLRFVSLKLRKQGNPNNYEVDLPCNIYIDIISSTSKANQSG